MKSIIRSFLLTSLLAVSGKANDEITVNVPIVDTRDLDLNTIATVDSLEGEQAVVFTFPGQPGTVYACGTNALEWSNSHGPGDVDLFMFIGSLSKRPDCSSTSSFDVTELCFASVPYEPNEMTEVYAVVATSFMPTYNIRIKCVNAGAAVPDDLPAIIASPAGTGGFKVKAAYNYVLNVDDNWKEGFLDYHTGVLIRMLGTPGSTISCTTESESSFGLPGGIDLSMFVGRTFNQPACVSATANTSDELCQVDVPNDGSTDVEIFAFMAAEFQAYDAFIRCDYV